MSLINHTECRWSVLHLCSLRTAGHEKKKNSYVCKIFLSVHDTFFARSTIPIVGTDFSIFTSMRPSARPQIDLFSRINVLIPSLSHAALSQSLNSAWILAHHAVTYLFCAAVLVEHNCGVSVWPFVDLFVFSPKLGLNEFIIVI